MPVHNRISRMTLVRVRVSTCVTNAYSGIREIASHILLEICLIIGELAIED